MKATVTVTYKIKGDDLDYTDCSSKEELQDTLQQEIKNNFEHGAAGEVDEDSIDVTVNVTKFSPKEDDDEEADDEEAEDVGRQLDDGK